MFKNSKFCIFLILTLSSHLLYGKLKLPALVSDNMVIQRDAKLKVWGWADENEEVTIRFKGQSYAIQADPDGKWMVWLPPAKAGGPYTMEITGSNDEITLSNILVGDVWLCAGQSNMVHYLDLHKERYSEDIAEADYPEIRQFLIPTTPRLQGPADDISGGSWKAATPENVLRFSVVAYFFAKKLYDKYGVPIGLINASVGGSPIEAWTSEAGLREFPEMLKTTLQNRDTAYVKKMNQLAEARRKKLAENRPDDRGLTGKVTWYHPSYQPKDWNTINIPGYWEDQGVKDLDGVVWYRREIEVPASMTGMPAKIALGRIVDADELYINGKLVGNTTYQYPQRRYEVPPHLLNAGKNIVVVRVTNQTGKGGFVPDKPYYLAAGGDTLDLTGYWQYKVGAVFTENPGVGGISMRHQPAGFYNGMIAPLTKYAIKGVLWYQGESNAGRPAQYKQLMPALIADWRKQWGQNELPFLYVQLPNYMEVNYSPSESSWALLREAQLQTLSVPKTAMAIAIDLGEWNDIHPGNKKPVGQRLALAAQKVAYGEEDVVFSGPIYSSATVENDKVVLEFKHVGSGLTSKDGEELRWFAIAGEDKEFVWANAAIEGDKVVIWNEVVSNPVYVRYAWADNPDKVNFYNKEGLPASPFQSKVQDLLWYGKKAAVVLTYDDALDEHLDYAIPQLDSLGFKGTFYLTAAFSGSKDRIADWKRAAENGHELGNHTLFHPCDATKPGRSWVSTLDDLSKYTTQEFIREIEMTNAFLKSLDGKDERTFAYTCGDTESKEGSIIDATKDLFVAMRGVDEGLNKAGAMDYTSLNAYVVNEKNADQLISWAEKAKEENALLIILFHGVGGGHSINVALNKHHDFLHYLKKNENDFWVTTLLEASRHSRERIKTLQK